MILYHLDVKSMLNCRLVNNFWDKRASSVLKRRPAWIKVGASSAAFTQLYECVSKSKDFPFPGLKLIVPEGADRYFYRLTTKAPKYFRKFGKIHTHLQIAVKFPCDVDLIEKVLCKLPDIKFLGFNRLGKEDEEEEELNLKGFSMPKLTTFCFLGLRGTVSERGLKAIINAVPSLENISHVRPGLVPLIWENKENVKLVSSMILKDHMRHSISQQLAANPPRLKVLSILGGESGPPNRAFLTALKEVFLRSKDTLQKLVIDNVYINLDQVPVFGRLRELDITVRQNQAEKYSFKMVRKISSSCFPKLHKIRLDLDCKSFTKNLNSGHFEVAGEELESVDILELNNYFVPMLLQNFWAENFLVYATYV